MRLVEEEVDLLLKWVNIIEHQPGGGGGGLGGGEEEGARDIVRLW